VFKHFQTNFQKRYLEGASGYKGSTQLAMPGRTICKSLGHVVGRAILVCTLPTVGSCRQEPDGKTISPAHGGFYFGGIEVDDRQYLMLLDRRNFLLENAIEDGALVISVTKN
jgi:hypothetical protein